MGVITSFRGEPMNSTEVIILAGSLILVSLIAYFSIKFFLDKKRHESIIEVFSQILPLVVLKKPIVKFYDYCFENQGTQYLIKVLPFDLHHELIITNKYYWCMNADLKGWKRSTIPDTVCRMPNECRFEKNFLFDGKNIRQEKDHR